MTETDGSGSVQASYVHGGSELLAQVRGSGAGATASYVLPDGQGSVRALANSAGAITDTYRYDAYGTQTSSSGTTTNPYRYDGQRRDDGTGLYQLRARSYDPGTGRFLSRDTAAMDLTNPIELNRYEYAQDDPINFLDPSGREALPDYAFEIEEDEEVIVPPRSPIPTIARRIGEILLVMALALTLPSDSPLPGPVASPRPRPRPLPQPQPQPQPQPSPAPVPLPAPTPDPSKRQHCPISSENDFIHANSKGRGGRALQVFGKVRGPEGGDADCHVNVQVDPPDVNLHVRLEQSGFYTANGAQIGEEGNECGMRDYVCAANVVSSQQAKYFASRTQDDFWTQERVFAWFLEQTEPRFLALQLFPSRIAP